MHICVHGGIQMPGIIKIAVGDTLELKKEHPCGNKLFEVATKAVSDEPTQRQKSIQHMREEWEEALGN